MNSEKVLIDGVLANPEDQAARLVYADWLEERGDPRAQLLRMDPELRRISYVAWLEDDGSLDYYVQRYPEVKRDAERWHAAANQRERRSALSAKVDPDWVNLIDSLGCPFQPFFFFDNTTVPNACQPDDLPFSERIGTRGPVVVFETDFRDQKTLGRGLAQDLRFLSQLELETCSYGAARCPVHPFLCEVKTKDRPLTGADVLKTLRARKFHSTQIRSLEATSFPAPPYCSSDGDGLHNDEIHDDFEGQNIFRHGSEDDVFEVEVEGDFPYSDEDGEDEHVDEFDGTHGVLKRYVVDGKLWYILLHTTPKPREEFLFSDYVVLFAVGLSPHGDRLLGVVTHQVCHNLCD